MSKRYITFILLSSALFICPCGDVYAISDSTNVHKHGVSIGVSFGTNGLGFELGSKPFKDEKISFRLGTTYLQYHRLFSIDLNSKSTINIEPDLKFNQILLSTEYYPFKKSNFHLFLGSAYLYNFNISAFVDTDTGINIDGVEVNAEDFGEINVKVEWNKIVPFIGLGFGRIIPRKKVGFNVELGCYYMGKPRIKSEYFGVLDTTNADELIPIIEKNITGYSYLPFINFKVRYRIGN